MRVLAFCDYYTGASCGGAERVAHEVYRRLAAQHGFEVVVVGTGPRTVPATDPAAGHEPLDGGGPRQVHVPGRDLSASLGVQLTVSAGLPRVVRQLVTEFRPTVLHANSLHFQGTAVAARIARRSGIPLATTAHLGSTELLPWRMRVGASAWDHTVGRYVTNASAHVIAVSEAVSAHLQSLGVPAERVTVAYNGVDHEVFHARGRAERTGPLRIGFVGRLIANKGPQVLMAALGLLAGTGVPFEATVIGDGPMREELEGHARDRLAGQVVTFTGHCQDVADRMRQLDVVVRPSYTEGLPLGVIEAMACGAVVVCSDVPGNLELVDDGSTGLVFPVADSVALARALSRLAGSPDLLDGLREKAQARAADLSWDASARRHRDVLQSIRAIRSEP